MITGRDLLVRVNGTDALRLGAIEIHAGQRVGVQGANGSGKSTLLRVLAGFQSLTSGHVQGLLRPGDAVLVHQQPHLFRGTARSNVLQALRWSGHGSDEADAWLDRLGATALADRPAKRLSGGERARIAVARGLAARPKLLLLDEPMAALDEDGRAVVRTALQAYEGMLVLAAPTVDPDGLDQVVDL